MSVALSTWCRSPHEAPDAWRGRAMGAGATGVVLERGADEPWASALRAALTEELPVVAIEADFPRPRSGVAPRLAALDKEERQSALTRAFDALTVAVDTGAKVLIARLGAIDTKHDWAKLALKFARRERLGTERLAAERMQLAPMALDLSRYALDPLLDRAAGAGVTVAIVNRVRPFEIPDDFELRALMDEFRGAPLAPWLDGAALHARASLGFTRVSDWLATYGEACAGVYLSDAAGLRGGLPWGSGEVDRAALPKAGLRVVHCSPGATDEELAKAIRGA